MKIYAGIGSRQTPSNVLICMSTVAARLNTLGWTLRSGGAAGADSAFAFGAGYGPKEIYLPWGGFNNIDDGIVVEPTQQALQIACDAHPAWDRCSRAARLLHTRNVYQVLGPDLNSPVDMVVCWTKNGMGGGGTGQALRIARARDIRIFDLGNGVEVLQEIAQYLKS